MAPSYTLPLPIPQIALNIKNSIADAVILNAQ